MVRYVVKKSTTCKKIPTDVLLGAVRKGKIKHIAIRQAVHDFSINFRTLTRYVHHIEVSENKWPC